jgi:hypothetical protein
MSVNLTGTTNVLADQYRCLDDQAKFEVQNGLAAAPGYFRFAGITCYGRTSQGFLQPDPEAELYDVAAGVTSRPACISLPFDPDETVGNLRYERYTTSKPQRTQRNLLAALARKAYYTIRPLLPVSVRKHLQRAYLSDWDRIPFPSWPVDRTVENIFEQMLLLSMKFCAVEKIPFVWFWPEGYTGCMMMTHDIETEAGRDFSTHLADIDCSLGIKSSFQVVPEERYAVRPEFLDSLRSKGCEVNLHGDNHDGQLFRERQEFLRRAKRINRYAKEFGAGGFRSPVLYRNADWFEALDVSYDMSVPTSAHLEPQRGGCCTVMPYFIGDIVELPLTMTQDYSLFHILGERSIALWKTEIDLVMEKHGLVSFNTHPDYIMEDGRMDTYEQLLRYLNHIRVERHAWMALPGEIASWWRQRHQMRVVRQGDGFRIVGPSSERAVLACARSKDGHITYELPEVCASIV